MAITIQAPLAQQLFALGQTSDGTSQMKFQGSQGSGYQGSESPSSQGGLSAAPKTSNLSSVSAVAGSLIGKGLQQYMNAPATDDSKTSDNTGYGIGKALVAGDVNDPEYAKAAQSGIFGSLFGN